METMDMNFPIKILSTSVRFLFLHKFLSQLK